MIINKSDILNILKNASAEDIIPYIETAFTAYSQGLATVPPVGTLTFEQPPGDVHIKYGYIKGDSIYAIKVASGFYDNPTIGLPSSNGLVLVFNQKNGLLETVLLDEGYLTDLRTAIAGAVVAKYFSPTSVQRIGIVGTGIQARMQLQYLKGIVPCEKVLVWGRSPEKLAQYVADTKDFGFQVETTLEVRDIARTCNYIVTTTPSTVSLIAQQDLQKNTHITAMGADTHGKQEVEIAVVQAVDLLVVDSISQCLAHGEIHKAAEQGLVSATDVLELGAVIADPDFQRKEGATSLVDLTGVATQDIQMAKFVLEKLRS